MNIRPSTAKWRLSSTNTNIPAIHLPQVSTTLILHLCGSPPGGKAQDTWLQTAFHWAIQGLYLPYRKLKPQLPPIRLLEGCDGMINRRRGLGISLKEVPERCQRAADGIV